jgi:hypothetical protein
MDQQQGLTWLHTGFSPDSHELAPDVRVQLALQLPYRAV